MKIPCILLIALLPFALIANPGKHLRLPDTGSGYHLIKQVPISGGLSWDYVTVDDAARREARWTVEHSAFRRGLKLIAPLLQFRDEPTRLGFGVGLQLARLDRPVRQAQHDHRHQDRGPRAPRPPAQAQAQAPSRVAVSRCGRGSAEPASPRPASS